MMRVFLAGKVDPEHGAWRDALLDRVWTRDGARPRWVLPREPGETDGYPEWPQEPNRWVLDTHQYAGPFVVQPPVPTDTKYTGDFHGNTWIGSHGWMDGSARREIVLANRRAIRAADLFFCYLNAPDCFGTLVELGYAAAHHVFSYVLVGPDAEWDDADYWYAGATADAFYDVGGTPLDDAEGYQSFRYQEERRRPTPEEERRCLRSALYHAVCEWTARPNRHPTDAPLEPTRAAPMTEAQRRLSVQLLDSFSSIAQWTSDPRVRNEAARMLGVLGAPVPYAPGQRG